MNKNGYNIINGEQEHRKKVEVVHHIDQNRQNNSLNNLMIFPNQKAHASFHQKFDKFGFSNNQIRNQIAFRWEKYKQNQKGDI